MLSKLIGPFWVAPLFAGFVSAIILGDFWLVKPHSLDVGTLVCFLPMAFFMAAAAQVGSQKQVRDLQKRIEQLEAQAAR